MRNFYLFCGVGSAGKSTFVETIEHGVGSVNCAAMEMSDFASRFEKEQTLLKRVIIVSEAGTGVDRRQASTIVETFKKWTGNDLVVIGRKNKVAVSTHPTAKIIVISNSFLSLLDDSGALYDRVIPVPFYNRIAEPDKHFPLKLRAEMPGIVCRAIQGYRRLQERGGFDLPQASKDMLDELRERGSPVLSFLEKNYTRKPGGFSSTADLFKQWQAFCDDNNFECSNVVTFAASLKVAAPYLRQSQRREDGKRQRGFSGISKI